MEQRIAALEQQIKEHDQKIKYLYMTDSEKMDKIVNDAKTAFAHDIINIAWEFSEDHDGDETICVHFFLSQQLLNGIRTSYNSRLYKRAMEKINDIEEFIREKTDKDIKPRKYLRCSY